MLDYIGILKFFIGKTVRVNERFVKFNILIYNFIYCFATGMYLTDLTYIDAIHPNTGGLDDARTRKVCSYSIVSCYYDNVHDWMQLIMHVSKQCHPVN